MARDTMLALVILVVNSALMFTGRIKMFSLIPGMFFGFAGFFATYFGGFGWDPTNPWVAWVCVIAMTALGPVYAWLAEWLVKAPSLSPAAATSTPHTGGQSRNECVRQAVVAGPGIDDPLAAHFPLNHEDSLPLGGQPLGFARAQR